MTLEPGATRERRTSEVGGTRERRTVEPPTSARRDLHRDDVLLTRPSELRHSCASLLADMGVANEQIADLLGHTTTRMVERVYRHRLRPVADVATKAGWTRTS